MASVIEQRSILVQQNIPKLVKSLTGFSVSFDSTNSCTEF